MYEYRARISDVYDGDTFTAVVDLGFHVALERKFRLAGIQAPELRGTEKEAGRLARDFLRGLVDGLEVRLRTFKDRTEKYGRYLADILLPDGRSAADELVKEGLAVHWDGTGPRPSLAPAETATTAA